MFYLAIAVYVDDGMDWRPHYFARNGVEWYYIALTALFLSGFHPETVAVGRAWRITGRSSSK